MRLFFIVLSLVAFYTAGVISDSEIFAGQVGYRIVHYIDISLATSIMRWFLVVGLLLFVIAISYTLLMQRSKFLDAYSRRNARLMVRNLTWIASFLLILGGVSVALESTDLNRWTIAQIFFVGLFASIVGFAELMSRYNDDPHRLLASNPTAIYICVNLAAGVAALALTKHFHVFPDGDNQQLLEVFLASFGAIAFFRTSLFTARVGDKDIGIGPSTLLKSLLDSSDLMTDREQAAARAENVSAIMPNVDFEKAKVSLPTLCFLLVQGLTPDQQKDVGEQIVKLSNDVGIDSDSKALILGVYLVRQVGALVLAQAVNTLGKQIVKSPNPVPPQSNPGASHSGTRSTTGPTASPAAGLSLSATETHDKATASSTLRSVIEAVTGKLKGTPITQSPPVAEQGPPLATAPIQTTRATDPLQPAAPASVITSTTAPTDTSGVVAAQSTDHSSAVTPTQVTPATDPLQTAASTSVEASTNDSGVVGAPPADDHKTRGPAEGSDSPDRRPE